ncbi:hypothetical protein DL546_005030 [Coniochaeta pulveracea]|uniref:Uncharacterized protein n=1 Tax=Coniochaeta pulveracea TaxID=177199 RepID=A0A420YIZ9_9PEZI|nr:hypothetical protein DL546_005030 [Coniochaeta pulveracea]
MSEPRTFTWDYRPTGDRDWVIQYDGRRSISQDSWPPKMWATACFNRDVGTNNIVLRLTLVRLRDENGIDVAEEVSTDAGIYYPEPRTHAGVLDFDIDTPNPARDHECGTFIFVFELIGHGRVLKTANSHEFVISKVYGR